MQRNRDSLIPIGEAFSNVEADLGFMAQLLAMGSFPPAPTPATGSSTSASTGRTS